MITQAEITKYLSKYIFPNTSQALISEPQIESIAVSDKSCVSVFLRFGFATDGLQQTWSDALTDDLQKEFGFEHIHVSIATRIRSHKVQEKVRAHPAIKNVISIASGKGGVGKSTLAVNLALALKAQGSRVGLLDADIYGPSQPTMLNTFENPVTYDKKTLEPVRQYGIQVMSLGFLAGDDATPMIWRGPMATSALMQLFHDTNWCDLDYLIIDLPPGTGDIQLTLVQKIPLCAALIVSTPQDVAAIDAKKALAMFNKVDIPVLGVVENMSIFHCPNCNHATHIFGESAAKNLAKKFDVPLLGGIPLSVDIQVQSDKGKPIVEAQPASISARAYKNIAFNAAYELSKLELDTHAKFPKIKMEQV